MKIRIGTRKSKLAMIQTNMVVQELKEKFSDIEIEIVHIVTQGDLVLDKPLTQLGGKGVFITELEEAMLSGEVDAAVHSAKDLPLELAEGLEISGVLARGNYRDVLVTRRGEPLVNQGDFVVGTSSMRRIQGVKKLYPEVTVKDIRGNVDTRLRKLMNGEYDGIILAAAGLERLGLYGCGEYVITPFEYSDFLPAPCQGIIAIECRKGSDTAEYIKKISHEETLMCYRAEKSVPRLLSADCGTPLGAFSYIEDGNIHMHISVDGNNIIEGKAPAMQGEELAGVLVKKL